MYSNEVLTDNTFLQFDICSRCPCRLLSWHKVCTIITVLSDFCHFKCCYLQGVQMRAAFYAFLVVGGGETT